AVHDSAFRIEDGKNGLHGPDPGVVGTTRGLEQGDYIMSRNTLQLEGSWTPQDNLSVTAVWRGAYEASLQISSELEQNVIDAGAEHRIDSYEYDSDLREIYVDFAWGDWAMRAGKQQIVWGEVMGNRMSDIINPLDYSWNYIFSDWEDLRIPLWGVNIAHRFSASHVLELVWLPGAIDNGFEPTKFGTAGTQWGPAGFGQLFLDAIRASVPENDIRNSEFGARLKAMVGSWDTSLFWLRSRNDNPMFDQDWLAKLLAGRMDFFNYPFNNKFGGTFNVYNQKLDTVFAGECVYTVDEPYIPLDIFAHGHVKFESDSFAFFLGATKLQWVPFINTRNKVTIAVQFMQKFILDYDDRMSTYDMAQDDS
ncbi:MAG: hypothetical protein JRH15_20155, partial [Deltaproteobacteria bacterium]|nr:hypothetical protein [Deltaproteobacteria bacterium]